MCVYVITGVYIYIYLLVAPPILGPNRILGPLLIPGSLLTLGPQFILWPHLMVLIPPPHPNPFPGPPCSFLLLLLSSLLALCLVRFSCGFVEYYVATFV